MGQENHWRKCQELRWAWEGGSGRQVLEQQMKATCENERVKPLIISRDGRSRKLKLTDLSFIFPYETVHQLRVRWIRADMEVISQSREPHTTDSSSLWCTLESGEGRGEGLGVEKNWALSQSRAWCLRVFPLFLPSEEASAEAPAEASSMDLQVRSRQWELESGEWGQWGC